MTPRELCEYIANGQIFVDKSSGDSDYAELGRDIWPNRYHALAKMATEALAENEKDLARWYEKGQKSVQRKNQSGCCCIIDDNDKVVSVCGAHLTWLEEHGGSVTSQS